MVIQYGIVKVVISYLHLISVSLGTSGVQIANCDHTGSDDAFQNESTEVQNARR